MAKACPPRSILAAGLTIAALEARLLAHLPAIVHGRRDVDRVHLAHGRLQRHDPVRLDAIVGAERRCRRALLPSLLRRARLLGRAVRPVRHRAGTVLVEALHGAATARALVVLTLPLVVEPRVLKQHARADLLGPDRSLAVGRRDLPPLPFQIVDDRGEAIAGARAVAALAEHHVALAVGRQEVAHPVGRRPFVGQAHQRRPIGVVAQIDAIRPHVQRPAVEAGCRHAPLRKRITGSLCSPSRWVNAGQGRLLSFMLISRQSLTLPDDPGFLARHSPLILLPFSPM